MKIGIVLGSLLSTALACLILRFVLKAIDQRQQESVQEAEVIQDGDVKHV